MPAGMRPPPMKGYIAFVGAGQRHPLWPILRRSAERYALDTGSIEIRYFAPSITSPREQIEVLRRLTNDDEMRGVCVQIEHPAALAGVLNDIESRGVAIVPMMHGTESQAIAGFAGLDDEAIGKTLADTAARVLDGEGSIMVLHAGTEHPVFGPRLETFLAEMNRHPHVEIFARMDCQGDALQARQIMRDRSARYPRLSAWVSVGEWPTIGLGSEQELGLPPGCRLIAFGGGPEQWPLIRSGRCPAILAADYHEIGTKAIQFCETAIRRPSRFESRYVAPLRTIDAAGLEAYIAEWHRWVDEPVGSSAPGP
jgi:ABC-type sugar transport system substrate-binding protein